MTTGAEKQTLIPDDAFERGAPEGTLGAEEELWLADPATMKLAGGAQEILAKAPEGHLSGELIDCEIEANTGVHADAEGVYSDLIGRRRYLLSEAGRLGRELGVSGTHPVGDWREQEIIDKPHYQRLKERLGWLIRRNNTFALHVHYAVNGPEKAIYMFDRLREYVPHLLALSVNSPFWQGENTDMQSSRVLIFSRSMHRGGLPEPMGSWSRYKDYVDYVHRSGAIDKLAEIWWDVRPQPALGTIEMRASDAQADPRRTAALVSLTAALCDAVSAEYEAGERRPVLPAREIEENKWSAQRYGLEGTFIDAASHESVPTRKVLESWFRLLEASTERDLSGAARLLDEPTEADRQLEVWRETGSAVEVARDAARRTRAAVEEES
ncbi:YbdK family carboxylate-amine ligase [Rubrobacter marinus]|uniref:Putative glutamate--cysteine ligase 2 n=1 Tax=Rubrobacter marinus TaxID=2653852 RepID=A0A6G8PY82_9ACTN|nr:YbdK family carboxylate-amine ligase [Rubrobacter marinus]QIN79192.1 YbdK family carboxylate-amine ligase [Rubrobacter marinus]